jgi:hypothetical protein
VETYFKFSTNRFYVSLVRSKLDGKKWDDECKLLKEVAMETMFSNPKDFFLSYFDAMNYVFEMPFPSMMKKYGDQYFDYDAALKERYAFYEKMNLPLPNELDLIPPLYSFHQAVPENYKIDLSSMVDSFSPVKWEIPQDEQKDYKVYAIFEGILNLFDKASYQYLGLGFISVIFFYRSFYNDSLVFSGIVVLALLVASISVMASVQKPFRYPFDISIISFATLGLYFCYDFVFNKLNIKKV